jgi:hypothetical protein
MDNHQLKETSWQSWFLNQTNQMMKERSLVMSTVKKQHLHSLYGIFATTIFERKVYFICLVVLYWTPLDVIARSPQYDNLHL